MTVIGVPNHGFNLYFLLPGQQLEQLDVNSNQSPIDKEKEPNVDL